MSTVMRASGLGDIDRTFARPGRHTLLGVRVHFFDFNSGSSDKANVTVSIDSAQGASFDRVIWTADAVDTTGHGLGDDVNVRVPDDEVAAGTWTFNALDRIRVSWTNPDSGNIGWGLEVEVRDDATS